MEKRRIFRQGDVLLYELLEGEEGVGKEREIIRTKEYVVKKGETGNKHLLVAETPFTVLRDKGGNVVIEIKNGKAILKHEEHKWLTIPEGKYYVKGEREYNYAEEGWYSVRD